MHKIIENMDAWKQFQEKTEHTLSLWENEQAVESIEAIVEQIDFCYGADRDIMKDLGGYLIVLYGDSSEVENEFDNILQRYGMEKDLYEYQDEYRNGNYVVVIRLYICSSDYAIVIVTVP